MAIEIGSLLIDLRADVARLAQDMAKAKDTVDGAMGKIQRAAGAATTALGLIGAGVSVAGMVNVVKHAVDAMAALDDMAAAAGTTVENMSALADVAAIGGHQVSVVETAMVRLTKALAGGDDEAKGAGHALAALGLKAEDLRNMDTAEAMLEVAKALAKYENGAGKTALMMDLLGKSGAAAIPYFEDLAEAGQLVAKVTREQAEEAEKLEKNFGRIKVAANDMVRSLTVPLVGALSDVIKNFNAARDAGYGFWQAASGIGVRGMGENIGDAKANAGQRIKELNDEIIKHQRDRKFMTDRGDTQGARGYDAEIAAVQRRINYYKTLQRMAADEQWSGTGHLDARDLAARQKGSLTGYESKGGKNTNSARAGKTKRDFDPEGDLEYAIREKAFQDGKRQAVESERVIEREIEARNKRTEAIKDSVAPERVLARQIEEINTLRDAGRLSTNEAAIAEAQLTQKYLEQHGPLKDLEKTSKDSFQGITDAIDSMGNKAADTLAELVVTGKASFSDLVNSMLKDILRLQAKQMFDPITRGASDWLSGLFSGGFYPYGGAALDVGNMSANGNAFDASGVIPFANGGIVTRPTLFPFAKGTGLMGEAGPEAIMPLTRGPGGKLGVQAVGGGGAANVTVNIIESPSGGGQVRQSSSGGQSIIDVVVAKVKSEVARDVFQGGEVARAIQSQYGLNRAAGVVR